MGVLGLIVLLAHAASASSTAVPSVQPRPINDGKIICQMEIVTGSQIRQRICRTYAEWQRIQRDNEEQVRRTEFPQQDCKKEPPGVFAC